MHTAKAHKRKNQRLPAHPWSKWREQDGGSLVELAIVLPLLLTLVWGALEFGRIFYAYIEISDAARAGAAYGAQSLITAMDTTGMQTAATNDSPDILNWKTTGMKATASQSCVCSDGTTTTCAAAASTCASPAHPLEYVHVTTTATVDPIFYVPGLPKSYTLTRQVVMRVE